MDRIKSQVKEVTDAVKKEIEAVKAAKAAEKERKEAQRNSEREAREARATATTAARLAERETSATKLVIAKQAAREAREARAAREAREARELMEKPKEKVQLSLEDLMKEYEIEPGEAPILTEQEAAEQASLQMAYDEQQKLIRELQASTTNRQRQSFARQAFDNRDKHGAYYLDEFGGKKRTIRKKNRKRTKRTRTRHRKNRTKTMRKKSSKSRKSNKAR